MVCALDLDGEFDRSRLERPEGARTDEESLKWWGPD